MAEARRKLEEESHSRAELARKAAADKAELLAKAKSNAAKAAGILFLFSPIILEGRVAAFAMQLLHSLA